MQVVEIGPAMNAEQHRFAIEDEGGGAVMQRGLRGALPGVQFNAHLTIAATSSSSTPARAARRHRVEAAGLVLPRRSHRDWLKFKNPAAPYYHSRSRHAAERLTRERPCMD